MSSDMLKWMWNARSKISYIYTVVVDKLSSIVSREGWMLHKKHEFIRVSMEWVHYDFVSNSSTTDPVYVVSCENSHFSFITSSSVDWDR